MYLLAISQMWSYAIFVLGVLAAIAVMWPKLSRRLGRMPSVVAVGPTVRTYRAFDSLLSPAERSFYGVLLQSLGEKSGIVVFAKVRMGDLLAIEPGLGFRQRAVAVNRVMSKHVDFVLCDESSLKVYAAVELDDVSHERPDRRERDGFVDGAFAEAGIALVHVRAARTYSIAEVREQVALAMRAAKVKRPEPSV